MNFMKSTSIFHCNPHIRPVNSQRNKVKSTLSAFSDCSRQVILSFPISAYISAEMQVKHEIKSIQIFKWMLKKSNEKFAPLKRNCIPLGCEDMRSERGFLCLSLLSMSAHNRLTLLLKWAKGQQVQRPVQPQRSHFGNVLYCGFPSTSHISLFFLYLPRVTVTPIQRWPCALCCVQMGLRSRQCSLCFSPC